MHVTLRAQYSTHSHLIPLRLLLRPPPLRQYPNFLLRPRQIVSKEWSGRSNRKWDG
jgi:hypothetical protein